MEVYQIKNRVIEKMNEGKLEEAAIFLKNHGDAFKDSIDYYDLKSNIEYLSGDVESAIESSIKGLEINPIYFDLNYNLSQLYYEKKNFIKAFEYYLKASIFKEENTDIEVSIDIDSFVEQLADDILKCCDEDKEEQVTQIKRLQELIQEYIEYTEHAHFKDFPNKLGGAGDTYLGKWFEHNSKSYFVGYYDNDFMGRYGININNAELLRYLIKCEIFLAQEIEELRGGDTGTVSIIPIATKEYNVDINIKDESDWYCIRQEIPSRYRYYRVNGEFELTSNKKIIVGNPIAINKKKENKDLVLNLFIDGLSYEFLEREDLEKVMPNTYKFFKKGTICSEVYANGEWTLPSVATIHTGQYTIDHKIYHPSRKISFNQNVPILSEIFKDAGYTTYKIDGDWRTTPTYGYIRGIDRTIYQPAVYQMEANEVIGETILQLETFKDTNQYIWCGLMDLHKVADGCGGSVLEQSSLELGKRVREEKDTRKSVKKGYSATKEALYKTRMMQLDLELQRLYIYLEENFNLDNCIITLVSDHGQSFLKRDDKVQFDSYRTKVPLMIRGADEQRSDEIIQLTDYIAILSKLAGLELDYSKRTCNLPVCFGGSQEREFAYFESLFPKDPYRAVINSKEHEVYFESKECVRPDGRVHLDECWMRILDKQSGNEIEDELLKGQYRDMVFAHMSRNRVY